MNILTDLPLELQYQIYLDVPASDIIKLCSTNRYFSSLCNNADFWRYRAFKDFRVTENVFNDTNLSANLRYLELLSTIGDKCVVGSERFSSKGKCLYRSARDHDLETLEYFLNMPGQIHINRALMGAIESGDIQLVRYLIGLLDGKKYYLNTSDYFDIFGSASGARNLNLVRYLAPIIKESTPENYIRILNHGSYEGAKNDDIETITLLESLGADDPNFILEGAVSGNNLELFQYAIEKGANDLGRALYEAVLNKDKRFIDIIFNLGVNDVSLAFESAVDDLELLKYLVNKSISSGRQISDALLDITLSRTIRTKNLDVIQYLLSFRPNTLGLTITVAAYDDRNMLNYIVNEARQLGILNEDELNEVLN